MALPVKIDNFGGLVLTKDPKKGPFWTALKVNNCDIQSGSIDVAYNVDASSSVVLTAIGTTPAKTIFHLIGATFLYWTGDVDVAISPLAENTSKRVYFTGDNVPKVTDQALATFGITPYPSLAFVLGLPIPQGFANAAASGDPLAVTGGVGPTEARAYVYTYVSPWGEESAPCDPLTDNGNFDGTWRLRFIGALSALYDGTGLPTGIPPTAYGSGNGLVVYSVSAANVKFFREGDLCLLEATNAVQADSFRAAAFISKVDTGANQVIVRAGWAPTNTSNLWRIGPINSFNIVSAVKDTPSVGKVKITVDTVYGLRATEKVLIRDVVGMTDLNDKFYAVESISIKPTDISFVVSQATAQVYTSGGTATREALFNTSHIRITGATIAAGVVTITVDYYTGGTAKLTVGGKVLITGMVGAGPGVASELNGLRTVTAILSASSFQVALPAMTAYAYGGVAMIETTYPYDEYAITNVTYAANVFTFIFGAGHKFSVGELICVYDVGGTIEANNLFIVKAVAGNQITADTQFGAVTAYTAGGKATKADHQVHKRVYRTNTSDAGDAEFQFLTEVANQKCDFNDTILAEQLGDPLTTDDFIQPPVDMHSIGVHPHGFTFGVSGKELILSEPYQPHAFPEKYRTALGADIVTASIYGTTIVALTNQIPVNVTGTEPGKMRIERQDVGEPCTSKRSRASTGLGVVYRGTSGLYLLGYQGSQNATRYYLKPESFLTPADTITAYWGNRIIFIDNATLTGKIFDPVLQDKGLTEFSVDDPIYGLHVSPVDGQLWASYLQAGITPRRAPLFKIIGNPAKFTYYTQHILLAQKVAYAVAQVDWAWDQQSATMKDREALIVRNSSRRNGRGSLNSFELNEVALNGDQDELLYSPDMTPTIPTEAFLYMTVIANPDSADDQQVLFSDFVVNDDPVRLKDGIKSDVYQVQFIGTRKVTSVALVETEEELKLL